MFQLVFAGCLLAVIAAAPASNEKTFPGWPSSFSMTLLITEPLNIPGAALGEQAAKVWYDGESGNVMRELDQEKSYALSNYNGRGGTVVYVNDETDKCGVTYNARKTQFEFQNPMPSPENVKFLGDYVLNGEKVEQWQFTVSSNKVIKAYVRQQGGVTVPVRFEVFEDLPPAGSDMILPIVAKVKDFTAGKPDASVFEVDTSECLEVPNNQI